MAGRRRTCAGKSHGTDRWPGSAPAARPRVELGFRWWRGRDLNPRPSGYERASGVLTGPPSLSSVRLRAGHEAGPAPAVRRRRPAFVLVRLTNRLTRAAPTTDLAFRCPDAVGTQTNTRRCAVSAVRPQALCWKRPRLAR